MHVNLNQKSTGDKGRITSLLVLMLTVTLTVITQSEVNNNHHSLCVYSETKVVLFSFPTIPFPASVHGTPRILFPEFMPLLVLEPNFQSLYDTHRILFQAHFRPFCTPGIPFPEFMAFSE